MASSDEFESNSDVAVEAQLSEGSEQHTDFESDVEILENSYEFNSDWRVIGLAVEKADPVWKRLNRLIKAGRIPKGQDLSQVFLRCGEIFYNLAPTE